MTKRVIDVHLKVKAGVFLWTHTDLSLLARPHARLLSLSLEGVPPVQAAKSLSLLA